MPLTALGADIDHQGPDSLGQSVVSQIGCRQGQHVGVLIGQDGLQGWRMGQGDERGSAHTAAHVKQPGTHCAHRSPKQNTVESGAKTMARLRNSEPAAQKGVARYCLVFYKGCRLV
ncbi:MAG: hypothetical protein MO852_05120 [Candidatus Devosia euplotis]|nr:hypothetical protein [Candidatus Devosia euplotis]